jgi:DNA-binding transcriptional MerR regulator/quercetin dioxygenase-like cupin family protein
MEVKPQNAFDPGIVSAQPHTLGSCVRNKPCYNRARLEEAPPTVKRKIFLDAIHKSHREKRLDFMRQAETKPYLKIGEAAALAGVSSSVIRSWENLGLIRPRRSSSRYRLYSSDDVKLLKRAVFLRKVRGLNAPAIVQMLRQEGHIRPRANGAMALGTRLRQLRLKKGVSLAQVAGAAGISVGFLSALERSQMSASVGTLRKLAKFYKTNILEFFDPAETHGHLVQPEQRKILEAGPGVRMELLAWGKTVMEPHLFRIAPDAGSGESYTHDGEEFLHVLRGELQISLEGKEYRLKPGDSFYFESDMAHSWKNRGRTETWVLWINTPPTF